MGDVKTEAGVGQNLSGETPLATWMREMRYSDTALAAALGYDRSYIFMLRTGRRPARGVARKTFAERFAETFGLEAAGQVFETNVEVVGNAGD